MMQFVTILACLLAVAYADTYFYPVPSQKLQSPLLIVKTTKPQELAAQVEHYFTQDSLGQYSYGYSEPLSRKQEVRTLDGITRGSYSYIDANGLLQTVDYTADADGFHVAATNLPIDRQIIPQAVTDTPEVAAAREQHLAAHRALLQGDISASTILPKPVEDTPEVKAAKKEFFALFAAEEEKQKALKKAASSVPLATTGATLSRPIANNLFAVKSQIKADGAKIPIVNYGIQYTVPSNLARFYLPVA